ncbi:hypothetical protein RM549_17415 [Salegentibacter sp. F188]|uniref:GIY-YIG domain-containing protein n=1 Tax=Autumnicola patrickiae TaxID=3075591 RepID=A0ABU3E7G7_9FLAO|nr:hypothetical protein [Salegentibacter sp. F188]MDT0691574.1 hypothetical protein [Salegentibacter sp. F188]
MTNQVLKQMEKSPFLNRTNEDRLKAKGNIYFIYSDGELKYIGQRQAKGIKTRLDQHLFGKSYSVNERNIQNGTVSKWHLVKIELENEKEITFKAVTVEPDNLRTTIELELISRLRPEWNIQGKSRLS